MILGLIVIQQDFEPNMIGQIEFTPISCYRIIAENLKQNQVSWVQEDAAWQLMPG